MNTQIYRKKLFPPSAIMAAFLLSFCYWIYLALTSHMIIQFDAIGYEHLGSRIHNQEWIEYFRTGPNREPLYPLLISLSKDLGNVLSVPFSTIQTFIQVILLFSTQLLVYLFLKKFDINTVISALTLFYIGVSPALVNATFSLFSEIASFPIVLGLIWVNVKSWRAVQDNLLIRTFLHSYLF